MSKSTMRANGDEVWQTPIPYSDTLKSFWTVSVGHVLINAAPSKGSSAADISWIGAFLSSRCRRSRPAPAPQGGARRVPQLWVWVHTNTVYNNNTSIIQLGLTFLGRNSS